jgi:hypothetical protein
MFKIFTSKNETQNNNSIALLTNLKQVRCNSFTIFFKMEVCPCSKRRTWPEMVFFQKAIQDEKGKAPSFY